MPTISIFYGIVIQMYWRDHNPPHFHAYYQGYEALFSIKTGELIAGYIPVGVQRILKEWAACFLFSRIFSTQTGIHFA